MNEVMAILVAYLWFAGGLGWVQAYELKKEREMNLLPKVIVVMFFPALFAVSAVEDLIATWKGE